MWFKIELDKSGAITSCEQVAAAFNGSKYLRYVEAETKAQACSDVKAWYEKYSARRLEKKRALDELIASKTTCSKCSRAPWRAGATRCSEHRFRANGGRLERVAMPAAAESTADRASRELRDLYRHMTKRMWLDILGKLDALGPAGFRSWLCLKADVREDVQAAE